MFRWRNDPRVFRWTRQNDVLTRQGHQAWYNQQATDPTMKMYGIEKEGELIGVCGLTSIDMTNRRAEFSLYIGPEHQGKGYGEAALGTLLDHAFRSVGLNLVWGETFDGNPAAKLFEKLEFVKEGTRREFYFRNGDFIDAHLYSIKSEEWLGKWEMR